MRNVFKHLSYSLFFTFLFAVQSAPDSFWLGVKPNITLLFVLSMSILEGTGSGITYAVICGAALDALGYPIFGINALLMAYFALLCSYSYASFFSYSYAVGSLFVGTVSVAYQFIFYFITYFIWGGKHTLSALYEVILPEALYNVIFAFLVFFVMVKIYLRFERMRT